MIPHPKMMQAVTDQRWHEVQVRTQRERLAMTAHEQMPGGTDLPTLRVRVVNAVRIRLPILGRCLDIGMPRDAQRSAVP